MESIWACLKQEKKFLILIFAMSLLVRVLFFYIFLANNPCQLAFDSGHYHNVALQILHGHGISNLDGSAHFYRLPGYPIFLAFCYEIFGESILFALLFQILLSSLIPILIFLLALVLFPSKFLVAKISSLVSVFSVGFLIYSGLVMAETLFVLFFLAFLILFWAKQASGSFNKAQIFCAGIFLGLATLVRPVGHFVLILAIFLLFCTYKTWFNRFVSSICLVFGWLAVAGIWLLRNFLLTGCIFLHTLPGHHFLNHLAARLEMENKKCSYVQAQQNVTRIFDERVWAKQKILGRDLSAPESCFVAEGIALEYVVQNPFGTIKLGIINMLKTMFSLYSSELLVIDSGGKLPSYDKDRSLLDLLKKFFYPDISNKGIVFVIYFEIFLFILLLIGFVGFILVTLTRREYFFVFRIFLFGFLFIFLSFACGYARFRLPFEPFLIILSVSFWVNFCNKRKRCNCVGV